MIATDESDGRRDDHHAEPEERQTKELVGSAQVDAQTRRHLLVLREREQARSLPLVREPFRPDDPLLVV
jgi:hypothetical protein